MFTEEFIREGRRIFAEAKEAVASDPELYDRVETAEMPLCFLQMTKNPLRGFREQADELVRRVISREGITRMAEGAWAGGMLYAKDLLDNYDRLKQALSEAETLPATDVEPAGKGINFVRYEGDFLSTEEMLLRGKEVERGVIDGISIDRNPESDHFGYVFQGWLDVSVEGLWQFRITSDDGTVFLMDGKPLLNLDGSHSPETASCFIKLDKGFHALELRYFEDCEGQVLDAALTGPDGAVKPLSEWSLYR